MAVQKKADKWKLKKWFSVYAPKQFNDAVIGEMPANDEKSAVGRNIVVGLDALTHNPSHAYTNVVLKVVSAEGSAAHTKLVSITQLYSYIRSLVRRYKSIATSSCRSRIEGRHEDGLQDARHNEAEVDPQQDLRHKEGDEREDAGLR